MDKKLLEELLRSKSETGWFDFKRKQKLFSIENGKERLNTLDRDEFVKDILGLANGNTKIIRKTKYLVIGADDKEFTQDGMRVLHNVDYRVPTESEIHKWVNNACDPPVVGIECASQDWEGNSLYIITIHPTFDIHETTRSLKDGKYTENTIFMRKADNTVSASIRDAIAIQQLKLLHRQEIRRPSPIIFGAVVSVVMVMIGFDAGLTSAENLAEQHPIVVLLTRIGIAVVFGVLGALIGNLYKEIKEYQYGWPYLLWYQKSHFVIVMTVCVVFLIYIYIWKPLS